MSANNCNRLPMGLSSSADAFKERTSWLVDAIENAIVCVDDFLAITNAAFEEVTFAKGRNLATAPRQGVSNAACCLIKK